MNQRARHIDVDQAGADVILQQGCTLRHLQVKRTGGRDVTHGRRCEVERLDEQSTGAAAQAGQTAGLYVDVGRPASADGPGRKSQVASGLDIGSFVGRQVGDQPGAALHTDLLAGGRHVAHDARECHPTSAGHADAAIRLQGLALAHGQRALLRLDVSACSADVAPQNQVGSAGTQLQMPADVPIVGAGAEVDRAAVTSVEPGGDVQIGITGCPGCADQADHAGVAACPQCIDPQALAAAADGRANQHHAGALDVGSARAGRGRQAQNGARGLHRGVAHGRHLGQRQCSGGGHAEVTAGAQGRACGHGDASAAEVKDQVAIGFEHAGEVAATAAAQAHRHAGAGTEVVDASGHHVDDPGPIKRVGRSSQGVPKLDRHGAAAGSGSDGQCPARAHVTFVRDQAVDDPTRDALDVDVALLRSNSAQGDVVLGIEGHLPAVARGRQRESGHVQRTGGAQIHRVGTQVSGQGEIAGGDQITGCGDRPQRQRPGRSHRRITAGCSIQSQIVFVRDGDIARRADAQTVAEIVHGGASTAVVQADVAAGAQAGAAPDGQGRSRALGQRGGATDRQVGRRG